MLEVEKRLPEEGLLRDTGLWRGGFLKYFLHLTDINWAYLEKVLSKKKELSHFLLKQEMNHSCFHDAYMLMGGEF